MVTFDEYEKAIETMKMAKETLKRSNAKLERILDELCAEKSSNNFYKQLYNESNEVKIRYEIQKEVLDES